MNAPAPAPSPAPAPATPSVTPSPVIPNAPAPAPASVPSDKKWYEFWKKGGARKSRKNPIRAQTYFRQMRIVNGKVCMNREYRVVMTNKGQRITGHNGKRKFNMTRRFKKTKNRKTRKH
jgi:hypothetical protein